jgi:pSer/pThr/pTyr-binding forkhead associated (FHA) protein
MAHKGKKHIDDVMPLLKRKFQDNKNELWTDEQVKCMLDSLQTSVVSEFASKERRVNREKVSSILATAAVKASLESLESSTLAEAKERFIFLEFDDASTVDKRLAPGASFYIGRTEHDTAQVGDYRVFKHDDANICRRVSAKHCNIKNENGEVKLVDTSTNGTWVNDDKINKAARTLNVADKVKLYFAKDEETVASAKFTVKFIH